MSLLSMLSNLFGNEKESENTTSSAASHPCANCPSDCAICPEACSACEPYKKRLIDAVYNVDHLEEFLSNYEVASIAGSSGTIICPHCGASTSNLNKCEYCDSILTNDYGKIRVESASDIPNPIMQAQDIIFERYEAVVKKYEDDDDEDEGGILNQLLSGFTGDNDDDPDGPGTKMSEQEIKEAAQHYGVSVGDYLTGLDNGRYLTLSGYKAASAQGNSSGSFGTPAAAGISGLAAVGGLASALLSNRKNSWQNSFTSGSYAPRPDFSQNAKRPAPPTGRRDERNFKENRMDDSRRTGSRPTNFSQRRSPDGRPDGRSSSRPGGPGSRPRH